MQAFLFLVFLIWAMGVPLRLIAQSDAVQRALEERRIIRCPRFREMLGDAVFWWLWIVVDIGRWIARKAGR